MSQTQKTTNTNTKLQKYKYKYKKGEGLQRNGKRSVRLALGGVTNRHRQGVTNERSPDVKVEHNHTLL